MEIRENVPLAPLTTFKIGGAARYFTEIKNVDEIREALAWAKEQGVRHHVIAGGSNLLIPDEGLDALIIRITAPIYGIKGDSIYGVSENVVEAWAGCDLLSLIRASATEGLSGWEKMAGIPGTLGGAIRGNAGAFGTEIKDVLHECEALDIGSGKIRTFSNADCQFSYRNSFFKQHPAWVICSVRLNLTKGDGGAEESDRLIGETIAEREKRHLQNVRAAGSFFMNPIAPREIQELFEKEKGTKAREERVPAGWLIEKTGMKGARTGGAVASEQHPNYLVNENNATAIDVRRLADLVREKVRVQFGITLQDEVMTF